MIPHLAAFPILVLSCGCPSHDRPNLMPEFLGLPQLPLLVAGISLAAESLLRCAGLPCVHVELDQSLPVISQLPGRIVLYDAERAGSSAARAAFSRLGLPCVNISGLTDRLPAEPRQSIGPQSAATHSPDRSVFVSLRKAVERAGGIWLRIADYPHPYQSVLLPASAKFDAMPPGFAKCFTQKALPLRPAAEKRYDAGLPMLVPDRLLATESKASANLYQHFPLLWTPTVDEFQHWWDLRRNLNVTLRCDEGAYAIDVDGVCGSYCPALELWRGRHVAALPVPPGKHKFHENGVPFVEARHRSPAGFTGFCWGMPPVASHTERRELAQQSA